MNENETFEMDFMGVQSSICFVAINPCLKCNPDCVNYTSLLDISR